LEPLTLSIYLYTVRVYIKYDKLSSCQDEAWSGDSYRALKILKCYKFSLHLRIFFLMKLDGGPLKNLFPLLHIWPCCNNYK